MTATHESVTRRNRENKNKHSVTRMMCHAFKASIVYQKGGVCGKIEPIPSNQTNRGYIMFYADAEKRVMTDGFHAKLFAFGLRRKHVYEAHENC